MAKKLQGVDGWLELFIVTLVLLTPGATLLDFLTLPYLRLADMFFIAIIIAIPLLTGWALYTKKAYAVLLAKTYLAAIFLEDIFYSIIFNETIGYAFPYCIIWFAYLTQSKRVANTYGHLKTKVKENRIFPYLALAYSVFLPITAICMAYTSLYLSYKGKLGNRAGLAALALFIAFAMTLAISEPMEYTETEKALCASFCSEHASHDLLWSDDYSDYVCECYDTTGTLVDVKPLWV